MGKKKKIWSPFRNDDDDNPFGGSGDDDDEGSGFPFFGGFSGDSDDFNDIIKKFMKQFNSKDFQNFAQNLFKNLGLPSPDNMNPDDLKKLKIGQPFVYGFSVKFDENGKPVIGKFGNIKPPDERVEPLDEAEEEIPAGLVREPLADVMEEDAEIVVVIELPGVQKEDIKLNAGDDSIDITTTGERKFQKHVDLPARINPDVAKARYTNGILEIRLEKIGKKKKEKGANIPID
jgi:HSP20 family protein